MSLVSVVLPTYNRAEFVGETVESVLDQTYAELELVVVDGGSTDDTAAILEDVDDDRLRVERRDQPRGLSNARNRGIELADGAFVFFLDDDDRLHPTAVERAVEVLSEQPESCAGVVTSHRKVDEAGETSVHTVPDGPIRLSDQASGGVVDGPSGTMFRADVFDDVGGFDESLPTREDVDLWLRILDRYTLYGVEDVLYDRRMHEDQLIGDAEKMVEGQLRLLDKHGDVFSEGHLAERYRHLAHGQVRIGQLRRARESLATAREIDGSTGDAYYAFWLRLGTRGYWLGLRLHRFLHGNDLTSELVGGLPPQTSGSS